MENMSHLSLEETQTPVSNQKVGTGHHTLPKFQGLGFSLKSSLEVNLRINLSQTRMESQDTTAGPEFAGVFLPPVPQTKEDHVAQGQWQ